VERLAVGRDGGLWAIASGTLAAIGRDGTVHPYLGTHRPLDLAPDGGVVWVGTDNGIDVISVADGQVVDLLRTADRRVAVTAVAADGEGGCWAGTEAGQLIHLDTSLLGGATIVDLAPEHPPAVRAIRALDAQRAWVLTDSGLFAAWRPRTPAP
jgi:ligand-binding sensor domain-containing protein